MPNLIVSIPVVDTLDIYAVAEQFDDIIDDNDAARNNVKDGWYPNCTPGTSPRDAPQGGFRVYLKEERPSPYMDMMYRNEVMFEFNPEDNDDENIVFGLDINYLTRCVQQSIDVIGSGVYDLPSIPLPENGTRVMSGRYPASPYVFTRHENGWSREPGPALQYLRSSRHPLHFIGIEMMENGIPYGSLVPTEHLFRSDGRVYMKMRFEDTFRNDCYFVFAIHLDTLVAAMRTYDCTVEFPVVDRLLM